MANEILTLTLPARPEPRGGGGKSRASIKAERLGTQTQVLGLAAKALSPKLEGHPSYATKVHLVAWMFADSLAPSHLPNDLFAPEAGYAFLAPLGSGYLIEAEISSLRQLEQRIRAQTSARIQADISRLQSIELFDSIHALHGRAAEEIWDKAIIRGDSRLFHVWAAPLRDQNARAALIHRFQELMRDGVFLPAPSTIPIAIRGPGSPALPVVDRQAVAEATYLQRGAALTAVQIDSLAKLNTLVASGTVVRIDPVRSIIVTAPGEGEEPEPLSELSDEPVVAVVDGGCTARSYSQAEAWRSAPPFVSDAHADTKHGNAIVSLVVNGHAWNNNRALPKLNCRVGIVQAVPKAGAPAPWDELSLLDYLRAVAQTHTETKVWNISANQDPLGTDRVSVLGDGITRLARAAGLIPVISIGNVKNGDRRLQPPADCEAALVVGGRQANADGSPGEACPICAGGLGPEEMQKPDVSWFSDLRMLGGRRATASSWGAAITSPLVAHAETRLRDPSPDLVKALLLHATEGTRYDPNLGWGTPYNGHHPWECAPGAVTFAFRSEIKPGFAYYWDLPIVPELIQSGKLKGGFKLTAVLKPLLSRQGLGNYFSSRLQTNLQYRDRRGKPKPILGSLKEDEVEERTARAAFQKWQPVRHYPLRTIPSGWDFSGDTIRLYAQVFIRDWYQLPWSSNGDAPPQEVAFVLSLVSPDNDEGFYDSAFRTLGNFVETAVVQEVDVDVRRNNGR